MRVVTILIAVLVSGTPLVAQNDNPLAPPKQLPQTPRYYGKVKALCVGVNDYAHPEKIKSLDYSIQDAQEVERVLTERYGFEVQSLYGPAATKDAIVGQIVGMSYSLGKDDCLIVYLSGHGATIEGPPDEKAKALGYPLNYGFYLPYDCTEPLVPTTNDPAPYMQAAIDMRQLSKDLLMFAKNAGHVVLILDSCFSGFAAVQARGGSAVHLELLKEPSKQVMTAGKADQEVYEDDDFEHGVFTWALLRELNPKDEARATEILSLQDLYVRTRNSVLEWSQLSKHDMLPMHRHLQGGAGDFVFVPLAVGDDVDGALAKKFETSGKASPKGGSEARPASAPAPAPSDTASSDTAEQAPVPVEPATVDRDSPVTPQELEEVSRLAQSRKTTDPPLLVPKWTRAFDRFQCRAAVGDSNAMACLFYCSDKAIGTLRNERAARHWGVETGESDRNLGGVVLAEIFENGIGGEANRLMAEKFKAAVKIDELPPELQPFAGKALERLTGKLDFDLPKGEGGDLGGLLDKAGDVFGGRDKGGSGDPPAPAPKPTPIPDVPPVVTDPVALLSGHAARVRALSAAGSWSDAHAEATRWKDALAAIQQHPQIAPLEAAVSTCRSIRTKVRSLASDRGPLKKQNSTDTNKRLTALDTKIAELKALLDKNDDPQS